MFAVCLYAVAGGFIFQHLESTNEMEECRQGEAKYLPMENETIYKMWSISSSFRSADDKSVRLEFYTSYIKKTFLFTFSLFSFPTIFFAAKCRRRRPSRLPYFGCFSRYCWGRISPNINVATPNLVSLRGPSVPIVLQISLTSVKWVARQILKKNFGENFPSPFLVYKFLIYQPNRTKR